MSVSLINGVTRWQQVIRCSTASFTCYCIHRATAPSAPIRLRTSENKEGLGICVDHCVTSLFSLQEHKKTVCRLFPISCSLCNKKDIPRSELSSHHDPITGDCEEFQAVCSFHPIGCGNAKVKTLLKPQ